MGTLLIGSASAQSLPAVPYPQSYQTALVKYAVVDRVDGLSRDLYASRDAVDAMRHDPRLKEFPVGVLFALDVYRAKLTGHDRKTGGPIFEIGADGHLVRGKSERTLHLMRKGQPGFGSQNWTFGGFDPMTAEPLRLQLPGDCLLCHQAAVTSDMSFSLSLLRRFVTTGAVQYSFCAQPGRQSCPF
ncbi:MAG TPA: cytochrome P460 family protein [Methylomirabilota bacterium]|nr:cytochrome P460 family protein [Methylomirabilota bacterium]